MLTMSMQQERIKTKDSKNKSTLACATTSIRWRISCSWILHGPVQKLVGDKDQSSPSLPVSSQFTVLHVRVLRTIHHQNQSSPSKLFNQLIGLQPSKHRRWFTTPHTKRDIRQKATREQTPTTLEDSLISKLKFLRKITKLITFERKNKRCSYQELWQKSHIQKSSLVRKARTWQKFNAA